MPASSQRQSRGDLARPPAAAGSFYSADPHELARELDWCYAHPLGPGADVESDQPSAVPLALICPHAGLRYSGPFAAHAYRRLGTARSAVVLGPSHRGAGAPLALGPPVAWRTPLGNLLPDPDLSDAIQTACPELTVDARPHAAEHSVELQAIFLRRALGPDARLVPISVAGDDLLLARSLGVALAGVVAQRPALLVASTDLSHYLPDDVTRERDRRAVAAMVALDVEGLLDLLDADETALCGAGAVVAVLTAAQKLGARAATLLRYGTSADTGGGREWVVGYAALRVDHPAERLAGQTA